MTSVVVVGGGVAGLAAARRLALAGANVTVVEQSQRWGGKLDSATVAGLRLDTGAESVLARRPEAVSLIRELGLAADLVHPTTARPQLLVGGRLHALPPSIQGVPVEVPALAGLLSAGGLDVAAGEPDRPAPALVGDVAIGRYVDDRFGAEVTDRLLEPLLGGVYAGRARELSFAAVAPDLYARARAGGSLLQHAQATLRPGTGTPVFAGLVGGIARLVPALLQDLADRAVTLRPGTAVRAVQRRSAGGWRLTCGSAATPERLAADAVVLAVPAGPAGRLAADLLPHAPAYAAIPYASVAVVTLLVRGLRTDASGLLIPPGEMASLKALTHSSVKWDWVRERAEDLCGPGVAVVRASVGRVGENALLQLDDEALAARTFAEARTLPGWSGAELVGARTTRWGGALPQYLVGHRELVAGLEDDLGRVRGLALAGAAVEGVGIAACLGSAARAATKIIHDLGRGDHDQRAGHDQLEESRR